MIDAHELRKWVDDVAKGRVSRRGFLRAMAGLGLSGALAAEMLASAGPAMAQTGRGGPRGFVPTRRGGGGKLRLLWWQAPTILNAHLAAGTKDYDASRVVYEPLAAFDPDGGFVPVLAETIPTHANGLLARDGRSVTWQLKKGVAFHDARPFTADDVIFTWEFVADKATAAVTMGTYTNIDRIERLGDHAVRLMFKEPTPFWYDAFFDGRGHILPKHLFAQYKGANARNAPFNHRPVGTGPYRIVEFKPGDVVRYEINPNYHVPNRPFFDTVELKGGGDATSAARAVLQTGEYDFAWNMQVEADVLQRLEQAGKGRVEVYPTGNIEHIQINFTDPWTEVDGERSSLKRPHPILTDLKVRQAIAASVDRRAIAEQLYGKTGVESSNFLNSPKRFQSPNTRWEFDLQKASRLLDEAGWRRGPDGVRVKDGRRFKLLYQTSINPLRQKTQAIVKSALEKIGVQVELKSVNAGVYFSSDPGNPDTYSHFYADLQMYTTTMGAPDPQFFMEQFCSWEAAQKANNWARRNKTRWSNPKYDELWKQAQTELDPVKRAALFIQMNDLIIDEVVVVPVNWRNGVAAVSARLHGTELTGWDSNLWHLANWYREA
jgi:peptide/nickel transport system substrate-binding protein